MLLVLLSCGVGRFSQSRKNTVAPNSKTTPATDSGSRDGADDVHTVSQFDIAIADDISEDTQSIVADKPGAHQVKGLAIGVNRARLINTTVEIWLNPNSSDYHKYFESDGSVKPGYLVGWEAYSPTALRNSLMLKEEQSVEFTDSETGEERQDRRWVRFGDDLFKNNKKVVITVLVFHEAPESSEILFQEEPVHQWKLTLWGSNVSFSGKKLTFKIGFGVDLQSATEQVEALTEANGEVLSNKVSDTIFTGDTNHRYANLIDFQLEGFEILNIRAETVDQIAAQNRGQMISAQAFQATVDAKGKEINLSFIPVTFNEKDNVVNVTLKLWDPYRNVHTRLVRMVFQAASPDS